MYLMFILAINIGGALQPLFEGGSEAIFIHGIQWIGHTFNLPQWLTVFLAQGVGGGINTVLPLVPQIGLMYLFLSILEDSGYMARAAFVMDRLMQALGLPGKSFVPLIVGFGCNVPAIMGARTLDTPRERLITILMAPFMSCGARLAILLSLRPLFFGKMGQVLFFSLFIRYHYCYPNRIVIEIYYCTGGFFAFYHGITGLPCTPRKKHYYYKLGKD